MKKDILRMIGFVALMFLWLYLMGSAVDMIVGSIATTFAKKFKEQAYYQPLIVYNQKNGFVTELTNSKQVKKELAKKGPVVLVYHTTWCGSCQMFMPTYSKISTLMSTVRFYAMDADKIGLKEHQGKFNAVPTIYVGKDEASLRKAPCEVKFSLKESEIMSGISACLNK